ncbi:PPOX class F420-dependent oxidoreductase [Streptomyces alkaliphilus]|uniref:PPOX class F420-dependent oxidoreductase n=1 Tax=Streptomyces alkaliphilus TaxID=1472722 RepID=UPI00117CAB88|nr:PPOX class F420-dependent oxidoreductase [Streptomyces alkaliphilus]MQS09580.1 PPOX class F420-dependent oxidoreductase [Streptomyces alkaliphilus]
MSDRRDPREEIARLGAGKYLLVTTFRRNGRAVPTPVWVVADDDALFVWTVADSGKVKRLRNRSDVLLAPCDVRGRPTGPEVPGRAELLDGAGSEHSRRLIARRYGLAGRLALWGSRLRRGRAGTVGIRIVPVPSDVTPG